MNRRDFIKTGTGAFFIAAADRVLGAAVPSNRVRLAIVGCHERGRGFAVMKDAVKVPGLDIVVVCDVDSRAMDAAANWLVTNGFPAPVKEKDFRKVLEMADLDGVISETPDHFHAYSAVMAMRAGKHVYVEKPCAFCPEECAVILDTWKRTGKVFQQGSQRRSRPNYHDVLPGVRSGELIGTPILGKCWYFTERKPIGNGKVIAPPPWLDWDLWQACAPRTDYRDNLLHYNWHWFRRWGTGECGNNSVHFVDIVRWFMGVDWPEKVTVSADKLFLPKADDWQFYDTMNATWDFPGGKSLQWENCSCRISALPFGEESGAVLHGSNGCTLHFAWDGSVQLLDPKGKTLRSWQTGADGAPSSVADRTAGGKGDTTVEHMANFVDAIRANDPLKATANADAGVKSTFLAMVANAAWATGGTISIDPKTAQPLTPEARKVWSREYQKGWELA